MASTRLPKYCKEKSFFDTESKPGDTWTWKSLLYGKEVCLKCIDIQVCAGNQSNILDDAFRKQDDLGRNTSTRLDQLIYS